MIFEELPEFTKDLKRLSKKFRTLREDLEILKKFLTIADHPHPPQTKRISNLGIEDPVICKVKRFACKSLKGKGANTRMRVIYAYFETDSKIEFIEMYFKGEQEVEDRERIKAYYS